MLWHVSTHNSFTFAKVSNVVLAIYPTDHELQLATRTFDDHVQLKLRSGALQQTDT